jgi:Ca2+-binding RTX toxin-like protein
MRRRRALLLAVSLGASVLLGAAPVRAAVTSHVGDGTLTVRGDADNDIILVSCPNGQVLVDFTDPDSGPAPCDQITAIEVDAGGGSDRVSLDAVDPSVFTSLTSVRVDGGDGVDTIVDTPMDDVLTGGSGIDYFVHVGGDDRIDGGSEVDQLSISTPSDVTATDARIVVGDGVIEMSSIERLRVTSTGRSLRVDASRFHGMCEISTDAGRDIIIGGPGDDRLSSSAGDDRLVGNAGNDKLTAGNGDDTLLGGPGVDFLFGGPGRDRCNGGPGGGPGAECEAR